MIILAKEAILDPTWLDSDSDEGEDEGVHGKEHGDNDTLLSVNGSNSHGGGGTGTGAGAGGGSGGGCPPSPSRSLSTTHSRAWSIGTGSSLSVGSCGLGYYDGVSVSLSGSGVSLSGSEGSHSGSYGQGYGLGHGYGGVNQRIVLNQVDIVDMGVESVSSGESASASRSSQDTGNVFDHLYDLDRGDYGLSDDDDDAEGDGVGVESGSAVIMGDDDDEDNSGIYLPHHLISPPRLSCHNNNGNGNDDEGTEKNGEEDSDCQLSFASSSEQFSSNDHEHDHDQFSIDPDDDSGVYSTTPASSTARRKSRNLVTPSPKCNERCRTAAAEQQHVPVISPLPSPEAKIQVQVYVNNDANDADFDDESASSTDQTNPFSNCSLSKPKNLNEDPSAAGILAGDVILSILDCPGRKTRKKRTARKNMIDEFNWGAHAVQGTLSCMRSLRKKRVEVLVDQLQSHPSLGSLSLNVDHVSSNSRIKGEAVVLDGRIASTSADTEEDFVNISSKNLLRSQKSVVLGTFSVSESSGSRSPHKSLSLVEMALDAMKVRGACTFPNEQLSYNSAF